MASQQDVVDKTLVHRSRKSSDIAQPKSEQDAESEACVYATLENTKGAVDTIELGELLFHPSTRILEARMAHSIPAELYDGTISQLFKYLFLSTPYLYESVCLAIPDWQDEKDVEKYGLYFTRSEIHLRLFTYFLKRISCLPFVENDGYVVQNNYSSSTDAPFIYFLHALLEKGRLGQEISEDPNDLPSTIPGHGRTLILDNPRVVRAFEIFTQHPMKFHVQLKIDGRWMPEEYVVVWCQDVGTEGEGKWDLIWEYMSKGLARMLCPDTNYGF